MMPFFDMPINELENYRPHVDTPADFHSFWRRTLEENPFDPHEVRYSPTGTLLSSVTVWDVSFPGFGSSPIKAWLAVPAEAEGPLPCVVEFVGYGGGRGLPEDRVFWASAGFAHLTMDTRGQGSTWGSGGDTPDPGPAGSSYPGMMTRGIESPDSYYYRRLYVDAHHAVEAAQALPQILSDSVIVTGGSQGGALALASASLNSKVRAVMADVPFMANLPRAIGLTDAFPYQEVVAYLSVKRDAVESVFSTLSYFDVATLVQDATAPALFSVGLMDEITPPSTVYTAFNWYGGEAEINVYPYNGHEGGGTYQLRKQLEWVTRLCEHQA